MKHTLNYLNKLKEQGAKKVKIENILILLESDKKRSEQLCVCEMNKYIEINGRIETCYKCGKSRK